MYQNHWQPRPWSYHHHAWQSYSVFRFESLTFTSSPVWPSNFSPEAVWLAMCATGNLSWPWRFQFGSRHIFPSVHGDVKLASVTDGQKPELKQRTEAPENEVSTQTWDKRMACESLLPTRVGWRTGGEETATLVLNICSRLLQISTRWGETGCQTRRSSCCYLGLFQNKPHLPYFPDCCSVVKVPVLGPAGLAEFRSTNLELLFSSEKHKVNNSGSKCTHSLEYVECGHAWRKGRKTVWCLLCELFRRRVQLI